MQQVSHNRHAVHCTSSARQTGPEKGSSEDLAEQDWCADTLHVGAIVACLGQTMLIHLSQTR